MENLVFPIEVRQSLSHACIKPLDVEKVKRRNTASTFLLCPSDGATMKLVRGQTLTASCPHCECK
jgi:hypothetical protein